MIRRKGHIYWHCNGWLCAIDIDRYACMWAAIYFYKVFGIIPSFNMISFLLSWLVKATEN